MMHTSSGMFEMRCHIQDSVMYKNLAPTHGTQHRSIVFEGDVEEGKSIDLVDLNCIINGSMESRVGRLRGQTGAMITHYQKRIDIDIYIDLASC